MTKTELFALAEALEDPEDYHDDEMLQAASALREYAATMDAEPVADDARNVLRFFAGIDLATHDLPSNFAWYVLEARAVLKAQKEKT